jgi:predicted transcriptional regulator YdeE
MVTSQYKWKILERDVKQIIKLWKKLKTSRYDRLSNTHAGNMVYNIDTNKNSIVTI